MAEVRLEPNRRPNVTMREELSCMMTSRRLATGCTVDAEERVVDERKLLNDSCLMRVTEEELLNVGLCRECLEYADKVVKR